MAPSLLVDRLGHPNARAHKRSRLLSRMLVAEERPANESYQVDLAKGTIEYSIGGTISTWGKVVLLGTLSKVDGTWMWGFSNPSVTPDNPLPMRQLYDTEPAWYEAVIRAAQDQGDSSLHALCDYLSEKLGFLAAFPAEQEKAIAWLAVSPSLKPEWPVDHPDNVWCDTCGVPAWNAKQIIRGVLGGVCDACIRLTLDCMGETHGDLEREFELSLPPCILSAQYIPRVMTAYSAISYSAAQHVFDHYLVGK